VEFVEFFCRNLPEATLGCGPSGTGEHGSTMAQDFGSGIISAARPGIQVKVMGAWFPATFQFVPDETLSRRCSSLPADG
jgi:hypothetical protein